MRLQFGKDRNNSHATVKRETKNGFNTTSNHKLKPKKNGTHNQTSTTLTKIAASLNYLLLC